MTREPLLKSPKNPFIAAGVQPRSEQNKLAHFAAEQIARTKQIVREDFGNNKTLFTLYFPDSQNKEQFQKISLHCWVDFPLLGDAFSVALLQIGSNLTPLSRSTFRSQLDSYSKFLKETVPDPDWSRQSVLMLSQSQINSYINWLNRTDVESGVAALAVTTRSKLLGALRQVVEVLRDHQRWGHYISRDLHVPQSVWVGISRQHTPTKVIQTDELARIITLCVAEVKESILRFETGHRMIEAARSRVTQVPGRGDYMDLDLRLAAIDHYWPDILPSLAEGRKTNLQLMTAIVAHGGTNRHARYFYPSARELVPFVLLIAFYTAFNPEGVLTLTSNNVSTLTVLDSERIVLDDGSGAESAAAVERLSLTAVKGRAGYALQRRSFAVTSDVDNPAYLISFLWRWTERIRRIAPTACADRLFLFLPEWSSRQVKSFGNMKQGASRDGAWHHNLKRFYEEHKLRSFSLQQIRPTSLEVVHDQSGGDLRAIMAASLHKSADTFNSHYTSDAARERNYEALANATSLMARDRATAGRSDSRREAEFGGDVSAATPGWGCLDPYDSPIFGQRKGRACDAYGKCPICPLAQISKNSPISCARAYDLLARVDEAREDLSLGHWRDKWEPVRRKLIGHWLPQFPREVHDVAKLLNFRRLPAVE